MARDAPSLATTFHPAIAYLAGAYHHHDRERTHAPTFTFAFHRYIRTECNCNSSISLGQNLSHPSGSHIPHISGASRSKAKQSARTGKTSSGTLLKKIKFIYLASYLAQPAPRGKMQRYKKERGSSQASRREDPTLNVLQYFDVYERLSCHCAWCWWLFHSCSWVLDYYTSDGTLDSTRRDQMNEDGSVLGG